MKFERPDDLVKYLLIECNVITFELQCVHKLYGRIEFRAKVNFTCCSSLGEECQSGNLLLKVIPC